VTVDLDLDLEHTLDGCLSGDHRVQVWWRSGHLPARRSDLRKSLQTDRRTDDGRRAIALAHSWNELVKNELKTSKYCLESDGCVDIPSSISSKFLRTHWVGSLHLSASATCRLAFSRILLSLRLEYIGFCCCQNSVRVSRYSSPWIASVRIALFVTDWLLADSVQNS